MSTHSLLLYSPTSSTLETFHTKPSKLTAHTKAAPEYLPLAFLHTATAWPLWSQSLVSVFQLPEPAVEKSSWLVTFIFDLLTMLAITGLFQFDSVKSTLSLCKPPPWGTTRGAVHTAKTARMDWKESEKNFFLCENSRASLRLYIHSEILQIYRQ